MSKIYKNREKFIFALFIVAGIFCLLAWTESNSYDVRRYKEINLPYDCRVEKIDGKYYYHSRGEMGRYDEPSREISKETADAYYNMKSRPFQIGMYPAKEFGFLVMAGCAILMVLFIFIRKRRQENTPEEKMKRQSFRFVAIGNGLLSGFLFLFIISIIFLTMVPKPNLSSCVYFGPPILLFSIGVGVCEAIRNYRKEQSKSFDEKKGMKDPSLPVSNQSEETSRENDKKD